MKADTLESYQERIRRVLEHIEAHLEEPLPLDALAAIAHFSPYHFHRIFTGMVGESVKEHLRRLRLERAANRLLRCDRPVVDIAIEAGYDTHESFTRAFEGMFGLPPSAFRKNGGTVKTLDKPPVNRPPVEVVIRRIESMRVAYVRHVGPYDQVGKAWEKLMAWAGPKGLLGPSMRMLGISHDDPEITPPERLRYDAALIVPDNVAGNGEVGVQEIGGGEYAVTVHRGPYNRLGQTYAAVCGDWLPASGRELRDAPPLEFYLNSPQFTPPEQLRTEICLPLR